MILDKTVKLYARPNICQYYWDKGYIFKGNSLIEVKIEDLPPKSNQKIRVACDICGKESIINYCDYTKSLKDGLHYCLQCKGQKARITNMERYGVINPAQLSKVREKMMKTMFENGTTACSNGQRRLYKLYGGILNYPLNPYWLDIYFENEKIDCEFNGSGHDMNVHRGQITEKQFEINQSRRYKFIKSKGIKEFRIKAMSARLPRNDNVLLSLKDYAFYILLNTDNNWITFDIDEKIIKIKIETKEYSYKTPLITP